MSIFGVPSSAAGWLQQVGIGLTLLLGRMDDPSCELFIEHLDDLELRTDGRRELFQVKQHLAGGNLTDRAVDLWKTLRAWSELTAQGQIDADESILTLVTTQRCGRGTACALLRSSGRNPDVALTSLENIALEKSNTENEAAYLAFLALPQVQRKRMMRAIYICDGSNDVLHLAEELRVQLEPLAHFPGTVKAAQERLLGWWFDRIAAALRAPATGVSAAELIDMLHEIFRDLTPTTLPISPEIANLVREWKEDDENSMLVRQLAIIDANLDIVLHALRDYLRASTQLSEWTRLLLITPSEVGAYRSQLIDEWDNERLLHRTETMHEDPRKIGHELYGRIMRLSIPIREQRREQWIMRGTLQELAHCLDVGWHPDYDNILRGSNGA